MLKIIIIEEHFPFQQKASCRQQKIKIIMMIITFESSFNVYHSISFIFNYPENDFSNTVNGFECICESLVC